MTGVRSRPAPSYRRHGVIDLNRHWMVWSDIGEALGSPEAGT